MLLIFCFCKQKTAYEMRISDWSSDVCSSDLYARYGQDYFPKFLCAVPYSPVTGPRLLARDDAARRSLVEAIIATTREAGLSSAHVNFHPEDEDAAFGPGWLPRTDLQYHWHNDRGWQDFDEFLAAMEIGREPGRERGCQYV